MKKESYGRLMSAKELEETLGLTRNAVYTLLHTKGFPTIRIGARMFAIRNEVDRWLEMEAERGGYDYEQKTRPR